MRRKQGRPEICSACGRSLHEHQKVCACGSATRFMTFEERTAYEVEQWRMYQRRADAQAS
jgi:hypothetical protein